MIRSGTYGAGDLEVELTIDDTYQRRIAEEWSAVFLGHLMRTAAHGYDRLAVYPRTEPLDCKEGFTYSVGHAFKMYNSENYPTGVAPPSPNEFFQGSVYSVNLPPTEIQEVLTQTDTEQ